MVKTIVVSPSGDDDTGQIQAAFNACVAAGPGCTVHFKAGHFYTNNVSVRNFSGLVTGAGQGVTSIDSLRGLDPRRAGVTLTQFDRRPITLFPVPVLFGFDGGSVSMSDLTFDITAAEPAEPWHIWDLPSPFSDLRVLVLVTGHTSSKFDRVDFVGHAGNFFGVNVCHPILIGGMRQLDHPGGMWGVIEPTRGNHAITRSSFKGVNNAIAVQQLTGGKLMVGGNAAHRNVFDTTIAFNPSNNPDSDVEFSYNEVHTPFIGVWIDDDEAVPGGLKNPTPPGRYVVKRNTIHVNTIKPGAQPNGVVLADEARASGAAGTFKALVAHNTITIHGRKAGGISGDNTRDVEITANSISGACLAGIYAGTSGKASDLDLGWLIRGNDVQHLKAAKAPIWLGRATSQCTVSGTNINTTTVLDEGMNNVLIDVAP